MFPALINATTENNTLINTNGITSDITLVLKLKLYIPNDSNPALKNGLLTISARTIPSSEPTTAVTIKRTASWHLSLKDVNPSALYIPISFCSRMRTLPHTIMTVTITNTAPNIYVSNVSPCIAMLTVPATSSKSSFAECIEYVIP